MPHRYRVISLAELPPGTCREVTAGDRVVAIFNVEGQVYALDGICAHAGGPLGEGEVRGRMVTCPWHGWQFDIPTGCHALTERIRQQTFPVTVMGDDVFVDID